MKEDIFFDLGDTESEVEINSDVSVDFLVENEDELDNNDISELKAELIRLNKLNDL